MLQICLQEIFLPLHSYAFSQKQKVHTLTLPTGIGRLSFRQNAAHREQILGFLKLRALRKMGSSPKWGFQNLPDSIHYICGLDEMIQPW